MAKIANPIRFSDHFGFDSALLAAASVLNPTLNVDTGLFIDPLLIEGSQHPEIRGEAAPPTKRILRPSSSCCGLQRLPAMQLGAAP